MSRSRSDKRGLPADYLEPLVKALGDPAVLAGVRAEELEPVAFQLALYFGVRRDPAIASALAGVYERLVGFVTPEDRLALVEELTAAVQGGSTSVLALLPVLQRERDAGVVRAAAVAFATHMAPAEGDPLTGPRALRSLFEHSEDESVRAGLVGALLALGDARVLPLLDALWRELSPIARDALLAMRRQHASMLEAEWLLGWLEDADPGSVAPVARSLARLPRDGGGCVHAFEVERPAHKDGGAPRVRLQLSVAEAGTRLAVRLRDLARRIEPRGALDDVLRAWEVTD